MKYMQSAFLISTILLVNNINICGVIPVIILGFLFIVWGDKDE